MFSERAGSQTLELNDVHFNCKNMGLKFPCENIFIAFQILGGVAMSGSKYQYYNIVTIAEREH